MPPTIYDNRRCVLKTIRLCTGQRRRGREAEGTRLLNEHTPKRVSWVRIPSSPPLKKAGPSSGPAFFNGGIGVDEAPSVRNEHLASARCEFGGAQRSQTQFDVVNPIVCGNEKVSSSSGPAFFNGGIGVDEAPSVRNEYLAPARCEFGGAQRSQTQFDVVDPVVSAVVPHRALTRDEKGSLSSPSPSCPRHDPVT